MNQPYFKVGDRVVSDTGYLGKILCSFKYFDTYCYVVNFDVGFEVVGLYDEQDLYHNFVWHESFLNRVERCKYCATEIEAYKLDADKLCEDCRTKIMTHETKQHHCNSDNNSARS